MSRRVLVSQTRMPSRDRDSGSHDVDNMIETLLTDGWSVTFIARDTTPDPVAVRRLRRRGVAVHLGYVNAEELIEHGAFDLAVLCFWEPASRLLPMFRKHSPQTRIIINSMDLHFLRETRRSFGLGKDVDARAGQAIADELNTYRRADLVLTVSQTEHDLLAAFLGKESVAVLPLGDDIRGSDPPLDERSGLVFVGNFRHLPNCEAVEYLCRDILPLVDPEVLSDNPVRIVGNQLDTTTATLADGLPRVHAVGWVPSIVPYLERARACVVPLLHGAGVKRKVIQPMMLGTPVVTTSVGAEGLDVVDGDHLLIADDERSFARAIASVCRDDELWSRLAARGRDHADANHRLGRISETFRDIVERTMTTRRTAASDPLRRVRAREHDYSATRIRVREMVEQMTPPDADVLVISHGDDELLCFHARRGLHFPQDPSGGWAGFHPSDSEAAIRHLEAMRARGARFLVIPKPSFWWLHFYDDLRRHLKRSATKVHADDAVMIFDLEPGGSERPEHDIEVVLLDGLDHQVWDVDLREALAARFPLRTASHTLDTAPPPDLDPDRWTVFVSSPAIPTVRMIEGLVDVAERLGVDRAQPTHASGPGGGPPETERIRGIVARESPRTAAIPVLAVRGGAPTHGPTALVDAVTVGLVDALPADESDDVSTTEVWVGGVDQPERALIDRRQSAAPRLSVVIATRDRSDLLHACLDGFAQQDVPLDEIEVVVVDDGSNDGGATRAVLAAAAERLPLAHVSIRHAGRSAAKNLGILIARGEIVLLFDDDDVPASDLVRHHLEQHRGWAHRGAAILGRTEWSPDLTVTPLMRWLTEVEQVLFAYGHLTDGQQLDWRGFWEGRISCRRELLVHHGLHDQRLDYSIDVELAHRLAPHGLQIRYHAAALSHMMRPVDLDASLRRAEEKAAAQATISLLRPDARELTEYCRVRQLCEQYESDAAEVTVAVARARSLVDELGEAAAPDDRRLPELHLALRAAHAAVAARGCALASGVVARPSDSTTSRRAPMPTPAFGTELPKGDPAPGGPDAPALSVVIPVWSRTPELAAMAERTVERIWEVAGIDTEVIVIDNGSPHPSDLRARVHRYEENRGVATAWNAGVALARAETIAVLNSDCMVENGWDIALYEAANAGRRVAFPYTDHADGQGFRSPDQGGTAGWCFVLTRSILDEVGPFDERFNPAYGEDTDYWHRAWQAGIELSPVPAARVVHPRRSTSRTDPHTDWLLTGHRYKYGWKHGVDPMRAPPYYHRDIVEYHGRGLDRERRS